MVHMGKAISFLACFSMRFGEQPDQVRDYLNCLQKSGTHAWLVYLSGGEQLRTLPIDLENRMRCPTLPFRGNEFAE